MTAPIEIRFRKGALKIFLIVCVVLFILDVAAIFHNLDSTLSTFSAVVGGLIILFVMFSTGKNLLNNSPQLILGPDSIVLNTSRKLVVFPKEEIRQIEVVKVDDEGYVLRVRSIKGDHELNISWLEKTPGQIEALLRQYMPAYLLAPPSGRIPNLDTLDGDFIQR